MRRQPTAVVDTKGMYECSAGLGSRSCGLVGGGFFACSTLDARAVCVAPLTHSAHICTTQATLKVDSSPSHLSPLSTCPPLPPLLLPTSCTTLPPLVAPLLTSPLTPLDSHSTAEEVSIASHKTASGADFYSVNPKGNVPALVLPGGVVLNEGAATLQFIADQAPASKLAPANGTVERYQLINLLNYVATEVHQSFSPLFNPALTAEAKNAQLAKLTTKFDYLEKHLVAGKKFLLGDNFTVADSYLYITLTWCPYVGASFAGHKTLTAYFEGIKALPVVQEAHKKMGEAKHAA